MTTAISKSAASQNNSSFEDVLKIRTALAAYEAGQSVRGGLLPYAIRAQKICNTSSNAEMKELASKISSAYQKSAPFDFYEAIKKNDAKTVSKILQIVSLQDKPLSNGQLPAHYAIRIGSHDVVKYLLNSSRIDPFTQDDNGLTLLDHAFFTKNQKNVNLVLNAILGVTIPKDISGVLEAEEARRLLEAAQIFQILPSKILHPIHQAAFYGDTEQLAAHLAKAAHEKIDINTLDPLFYGMTPLHFAALGGQEKTIQWLLKKGVPINQETTLGMNAMHFAAIHGSIPVLKLLLDKKLDPNIVDQSGRTPLHFAIASDHLKAGRLDTVRFLIQRGADLFIQKDTAQPAQRPALKTTPFTMLNCFALVKSNDRDPVKIDSSALTTAALLTLAGLFRWMNVPVISRVFHAFSIHQAVSQMLLPMRQVSWLALPAQIATVQTATALSAYGSLLHRKCLQTLHTATIAKSLFNQVQFLWKNRAVESYRILPNIFLNGMNLFLSAYVDWNGLLTTPETTPAENGVIMSDGSNLSEEEKRILAAGDRLSKTSCDPQNPDHCWTMIEDTPVQVPSDYKERMSKLILTANENHSAFATCRDYKKYYHNLSLKYHPDKNPKLGSDLMNAINSAYRQLCPQRQKLDRLD